MTKKTKSKTKTDTALFTVTQRAMHTARQTRCIWRISSASHVGDFKYMKIKHGLPITDWITATMPESGRVQITSTYDKELESYDVHMLISLDMIEVKTSETVNVPARNADLVLNANIKTNTPDNTDIFMHVLGTKNQELNYSFYINDLLNSGGTGQTNDEGVYEIDKHFDRKDENQKLEIRFKYTGDEESEVSKQIVIPALIDTPDEHVFTALPYQELAMVMKALASGKGLNEAIQTSPTLYKIWKVHPHIVARDSRDSRYYLFKDLTVPRASARYDGVYEGDELSYSLNETWFK